MTTLKDQIEAAKVRLAKWQEHVEALENGEFSVGRNHVDISAEWTATLRGYIADHEELIAYLEGLAAEQK